MRWPPLDAGSYDMINSTTERVRAAANRGLEVGRSLGGAPASCLAGPLEIQRCHGEVTAGPHTHRSIASNRLDAQLMATGPF